jgi:large conductance mechanosensitive channel
MAGFKEFVLRGNVIDLAVGVIIGVAFGGIVASLTGDIITPGIGMLGGMPDFSETKLGAIGIGSFVNAVLSFLITALAVYVVIVKPYNVYREATKGPPPPPPPPSPTEVLLTEIRNLLKEK